MALNQLGLGFVFTAKDEASEVIERIKENFHELEEATEHVAHEAKSSVAEFGRGLAILAAASALVGGAFELAEEGDRFAGALENAAAAANASAEEFEALRTAALGVALRGTVDSAADAAETLHDLAQKGVGADGAIRMLIPTLNLVAISFGQISREQAAGLVIDTLREFRLTAEDAAPVVDKLALAMRQYGIRAGELEPTLRGVATGASLTGASLDDTLIALGLTKSVLPSVEQAARSLNLAFNQLASDHTRKELAAIGVRVVDTSGRMKPLIEILQDLNAHTAHMTEAQREAALADIFSARAGGGLIAIMQALSDGIRDAHGQVVTGAAAIDELRRQMAGAAGAAEAMRNRLENTFEGQKKGLTSAVQSVLQLAGESFAEAFKPILSIARRAFVALAAFIAAIPEPVKLFVAKVVLALGAVLMLIGGVIAAKAAIAIIGVALSVLGVTLGGIVAALIPAIELFAALALVVVGFATAFQHDIGGIATFFDGAWARIKLVFRGVAQLFEQGGFSGAVMAELDKAENAGFKEFAIRVYQIGYRLQRFFSGIADGFSAGIKAAGPVFGAFVGALRELGAALGLVGMAGGRALASIHSDKFAATGASIGEVLAKLASIAVSALTVIVRVTTGIVNGFRSALGFLKPVFAFAGQAIAFVAHELRSLVNSITGVTDTASANVSVWHTIGQVLGWVAGVLVGTLAGALGVVALALRTVLRVVRWVVEAFRAVGTWIGETVAKIVVFFTDDIPNAFHSVSRAVKAVFQPVADFLHKVVDEIEAALDRVIAFVGRMIAKIPARFRPGFLDSIVDAGKAAQARLDAGSGHVAGPTGTFVASSGRSLGMVLRITRADLAGASATSSPAVAEVGARRQQMFDEIDAAVKRTVAVTDARPVHAHVTVKLDGETVARATAKAERQNAARAYVPAPAGSR